MTFPFCNQADLHDIGAVVSYEARHWDSDGHERTERRNGAVCCPKCGLWWPLIEEPDAWYLEEESGTWTAEGWLGGVVCDECSLLIVEQPDGHCECYDIGG